MAAKVIDIDQLESPYVIEFIKKIDGDFQVNNQVTAAPWRYFGLPNFRFCTLIDQEQLVGVSVTSQHPVSEHLNFLYVSSTERSRGYGKRLIEDWLDRSTKSLQTIHVRTELLRTRHYYSHFGFAEIQPQDAKGRLNLWVEQCLRFNPNTYQNAVLMYRDIG